MRSVFFFLSFALLLASLSASACPLEQTPTFTYEQGKDEVVPVLGKMTEELYHRALDKVEKIYRPIVAKSGGNLVLQRDYNSETENARTFREGNDWTIIIDGFWFKNRRYQTYEMVVSVACHELGHQMGNRGFYIQEDLKELANEGEADYYATLKCMRKVFADEDNSSWIANYEGDISSKVINDCKKAWKKEVDQNICIRSAIAGYQLINSISDKRYVRVDGIWKLLGYEFETPDTEVETAYTTNYPSPQCRLDTYLQGALCNVSHNVKTSKTNAKKGTCYNSKVGSRPSCWYLPFPSKNRR